VAITLVLLTRSVLLSMLVSMLIFFLLRSWLA
jgi:branched-subunit amino acid transport protein